MAGTPGHGFESRASTHHYCQHVTLHFVFPDQAPPPLPHSRINGTCNTDRKPLPSTIAAESLFLAGHSRASIPLATYTPRDFTNTTPDDYGLVFLPCGPHPVRGTHAAIPCRASRGLRRPRQYVWVRRGALGVRYRMTFGQTIKGTSLPFAELHIQRR